MIILKDQLSPVTAKTGGTIVIGSGLTLSETSDGLPILQNAAGGPSGTVSAGNINSLTWYAATGNTVDDLPTVTGKVLISPAGVPTWGDVPAANVAAGSLGVGNFAVTGTLTISGAANAPGVILTSGFYAFGTGGVSAYYTGASPAMAYTNTSFPSPFNTAGNLLLQSRGDASRAIIFGTFNGTTQDWRWQISGAGHLLAQDDLYTIGASGATRPNSVFVGTGAIVLGADPGSAGLSVASLRVGTYARFQNVAGTFRYDFTGYWVGESIANNQRMYLQRAETSFAARSAVAGGAVVGQLFAQAFGTTAYQTVGHIDWYAGETISDTASGGRLALFLTKPTTITGETPLKVTTSQFDFFNTAAGPTMATTGGGVGVLWLGDAPTSPASNPTGGVTIYSVSGILKTKDTSGNVVAMGDASTLYIGTLPAARIVGDYSMGTLTATTGVNINSTLGTTGIQWQNAGVNRIIMRLDSATAWSINPRDTSGVVIDAALIIDPTSGGTITLGGASARTVAFTSHITSTATTNTKDFGATANRWRSGYFGTSLEVGAAYTWVAGSVNINSGSGFVIGTSGAATTGESPRMYTAAYDKALINGRVTMLIADNTLTANVLGIGGGTSGGSAVTQINFHTASTVGTSIGTLAWQINNSGNLIGQASVTLTVPGNTSLSTLGLTGAITSTAVGAILQRTGASTSQQFIRFANTTGDFYFGIESSVAGAFFTGSAAYASVLYSPQPIQLIVTGVKQLEVTTSLVKSFVDFAIGTIGTIDSAATPVADYSLVYSGATAKWIPRLINATVSSSGDVNSGVLKDGTQSMYVQTLSAALSGTTTTPTISSLAVYKGFINTMAGLAANQLYILEYSTSNNTSTGTATGVGQSTTTLQDTSKTWGTTQYIGFYVRATGGTGPVGQWRQIVSHTTDTLTVTPAWSTAPITTSTTYEISKYTWSEIGTSSASGATNGTTDLNDTAKSWSPDVLVTYQVYITSGTGAGQLRTVRTNTATKITITTTWTTNPDTTSTYVITQVLSSADKLVHSITDSSLSYIYRVRILGAHANNFSAYGTGTLMAVSTQSFVNAYGIVLASQIATAKLSAIVSSLGSVTADSLVVADNSRFKGGVSLYAFNTADQLQIGGSYGTPYLISDTHNRTLVNESGTIYVKGTRAIATANTNSIVIGDYESVLGGFATQIFDPTDYDTGTVTFTQNAWSALGSTVQVVDSTAMGGHVASGGLYNIYGTATITNTMTNVVGWVGDYIRVKANYVRTFDSVSVELGVVATISGDLNVTTNATWSFILTDTIITSSGFTLTLTFECESVYTKLLVGGRTTGSAQFTYLNFQYTAGTPYSRRAIYLGNVASTPQITFAAVGTEPTNANTIDGEFWYGSTDHALRWNSNGTIYTLGLASSSVEGIIKLANDLGGTAALPIVVGMHFGAANPVSAITATTEDMVAQPTKGQVLRAMSATTMGWSTSPLSISMAADMRRTYHRASAGPNTITMSTEGPTNYANITTTPTFSKDAKGYFLSYSAASGIAQGCRGDSNYTLVDMQHNPIFYAYIKTGAASSQRIHIGLMSTLQGNTDNLTGVGFSLLFPPTLGNIVIRSHDGVTESASGTTLGAWAASAYYLVKLRVVMAGTPTIYASINGGTEISKTTNIPTGTQSLGWEFKVFSTSGTGGSSISWIHCESGL